MLWGLVVDILVLDAQVGMVVVENVQVVGVDSHIVVVVEERQELVVDLHHIVPIHFVDIPSCDVLAIVVDVRQKWSGPQ